MSITAEQYQAGVASVIVAARLVIQTDIPELLRAIEYADAFGAIADPTLYREKHDAMMEDKAVLEAALPLYRLGKKIEAMAHAAADRALDAVVAEEKRVRGGGA